MHTPRVSVTASRGVSAVHFTWLPPPPNALVAPAQVVPVSGCFFVVSIAALSIHPFVLPGIQPFIHFPILQPPMRSIHSFIHLSIHSYLPPFLHLPSRHACHNEPFISLPARRNAQLHRVGGGASELGRKGERFFF